MRSALIISVLFWLSACNLSQETVPTIEGTPITLKISPAPTKTLIPTAAATDTSTPTETPIASNTPTATLTETPQPATNTKVATSAPTDITLAPTGTNLPVVTETASPTADTTQTAIPEITISADTPAPTLTSPPTQDNSAAPVIPSTTAVPDDDVTGTNIPETGIVNGRGLRLRTLPDAGAAVLTFLALNLEIELIGRSPDSVWLNILTPGGGQGWVMSQFVDVDGDITTLPLSDSTVVGTSPDTTIQVDGTVVALGDGLRLRLLPSTNSAIKAILPENSGVQIIGRNAANDWIKVSTVEFGEGWVATRYIETTVTVANLPVPEDATVPTPAPLVPPDFTVTNNRISGISATSGRIFQTGQTLGNRPGVFSKVGDSLTVSTYYLYPFGWGTYNLRDFAYYQPALNYFSASFGTQSVAADNGWTTRNVLNASGATGCQSGESALECEYRLRKPSVALIMLGTNDMPTLNNPGEYQQNLTRIVEISIANGVIPVLHTIPPREDYPAPTGTYNDVIRTVARSFDVPLVDFYSATLQLPNNGLIADKVHPSIPAQDFAAAADFTAGNLQHGFTIRNLMTLQVLDMVWRQVISVYG